MQLVELWGQDEHEVAVIVIQYTFPAEQWEMSSAATRTMNDVDGAIMGITVEKERYLLPCECLPPF